MPRFEPYTAIGIKRRPCTRCGQPGYASWNICSDNIGKRQQYRVLCSECDIGMNELALRYVFGDEREADIASYAARVREGTNA